jgi:hypothetical protein
MKMTLLFFVVAFVIIAGISLVIVLLLHFVFKVSQPPTGGG